MSNVQEGIEPTTKKTGRELFEHHRDFCIPRQLAGHFLKCENCGITSREYYVENKPPHPREYLEARRREEEARRALDLETKRMMEMHEWTAKLIKPISVDFTNCRCEIHPRTEPQIKSKKVGGYFCVLCGEQDKLDYLKYMTDGCKGHYEHVHCRYESEQKQQVAVQLKRERLLKEKSIGSAKRWARIFRFFRWLGSL